MVRLTLPLGGKIICRLLFASYDASVVCFGFSVLFMRVSKGLKWLTSYDASVVCFGFSVLFMRISKGLKWLTDFLFLQIMQSLSWFWVLLRLKGIFFSLVLSTFQWVLWLYQFLFLAAPTFSHCVVTLYYRSQRDWWGRQRLQLRVCGRNSAVELHPHWLHCLAGTGPGDCPGQWFLCKLFNDLAISDLFTVISVVLLDRTNY